MDTLTQARLYMPADLAAFVVTAGWGVEQTGGGCTALGFWDRDEKGSGFWWMTDPDGGIVPQSFGHCVLGRYDGDGENVGLWHFDSIHEAIDAVREVMESTVASEALLGHAITERELIEMVPGENQLDDWRD
jgi:hypothetical protein